LSKELNLAYSPVSADGLLTTTQRITINPQPAGHYTISSDLLDNPSLQTVGGMGSVRGQA
ncbi:MAG: hypothetical protein WAN46_17760, partial [Gammaproteobacteria bacterium]